jgi:hypothetical protein
MRSRRFATALICGRRRERFDDGTEHRKSESRRHHRHRLVEDDRDDRRKSLDRGDQLCASERSGGQSYLLSGIEVGSNTSIVLSIGDIPGPKHLPGRRRRRDGRGRLRRRHGVERQTWNSPFSVAAGTFSFTATVTSNGATGTRTVTNGVFDLPFNTDATLRALPDSIGSKMTATLNGQAWNVAIASGQTGTALSRLAASTTSKRCCSRSPRRPPLARFR